MANYITIDGGTSNTRISLVKDYKLIETVNLNIGAKDCNKNIEDFKKSIKVSVKKILENNSIREKDISKILASGMITSELGLCELGHIELPVDLSVLHNSSEKRYFPEISSIPFVFMRGVKKCGDGYDFDVMRGEETEIMGIIGLCESKEGLYILSGSHTKIIKIDRFGRMVDFSTTLTGEMIYSLAKNTILLNSIDLENAKLDTEFLIEGYEYCLKEGINASLFKVRVMDKLLSKNNNQRYSFFMGAVLQSEADSIINENPKRIILAGQKQIRDALMEIIKYKSDIEISSLKEDDVKFSVPFGAVRIFECKGE